MEQTVALVQALKQQLKAHGKTYADVGHVLQLSEASVKRLFSEGQFTLQRFERILAMLGMDFSELVLEMHKTQRQVVQLTQEQEAEIAEDLQLLLVAVSVVNGFSFADLQSYYTLSEHVIIQKLAQLDRLKMIELLPGNRIKLRIAANFRWLANGPIQQFFLSHVAANYFSSRFDGEQEKLLVINGLCSKATNHQIQQRMETFIDEVNELVKRDRALATENKYGNTLVLALRQWQYGLFRPFVKTQEPQ